MLVAGAVTESLESTDEMSDETSLTGAVELSLSVTEVSCDRSEDIWLVI